MLKAMWLPIHCYSKRKHYGQQSECRAVQLACILTYITHLYGRSDVATQAMPNVGPKSWNV